MKVPKIIKVCGYDVKILLMEELEAYSHGIYGHFSEAELVIRINKKLTKHKMLNTILHEIKHAAWYAGGLEDNDEEERIVTVLSNIECAIYRDNPELLEFIQECTSEG